MHLYLVGVDFSLGIIQIYRGATPYVRMKTKARGKSSCEHYLTNL